MADPIITFNELTGAAENSGCGPATAVTGTAAVHTNGASSSTLTFTDSPDLSTVSVDDIILLQSNSIIFATGGAWLQITAVDNVAKTVTINGTKNIAVADAVDYGIGGKAKNLRQGNYTYIKGNLTERSTLAGWILEFETDQTLDLTVYFKPNPDWTLSGVTSGSKPVILRSADGAIKTITTTADGSCVDIQAFNHRFENLKFENSAATKVNTDGVTLYSSKAQNIVFKNCIFGDATNTLRYGGRLDGGFIVPMWRFINCEIAYCTDDGILYGGVNYASLYVQGCSIHDNDGNGIHLNKFRGGDIRDTIIYNNGENGIQIGQGLSRFSGVTVNRCTIHGNTGNGILWESSPGVVIAGTQGRAAIINSNITGNGGYGIRDIDVPTDSEGGPAAIVDYNNFGTGSTANTSGTIAEGLMEPNSLTVDPGYTNTATADFSVDVSVKGLGFPNGTQTLGVGQSGTKSYVDIGAAQRQEAGGGGGGGGSPRLINGGLVS